MSIIQQLQDDIVNEQVSLASILRRAKILAYRLRHDEFKRWVDSELDGYRDENIVPQYRRCSAHSYYDSTGRSIEFTTVTDQESDMQDCIIICGGVNSLEETMRERNIIVSFPHDVFSISDQNTIQRSMVRAATYITINHRYITRALEAVRNKLLDFVLELQDSFPELAESDERIGEVPPEQINYMYNTHIHGGQNVLAAGPNIVQNVQQGVRSNDLDSLLSYLQSIGVSDDDAQELKEAVEEDGPREKSAGFGPRVLAWLGQKTAEGTLNATIPMIVKALEQSNGWLT